MKDNYKQHPLILFDKIDLIFFPTDETTLIYFSYPLLCSLLQLHKSFIFQYSSRYFPCIQYYEWLRGLLEYLYVELLHFIVENWKKGLLGHLQNAHLSKYVTYSNVATLTTVSNGASHTRIYVLTKELHIYWLTKWFRWFGSATKYYPMHFSNSLDHIVSHDMCDSYNKR